MQDESDRRRRFDELFASYSADIVAYCNWRAASTSDAQDAVADVFLTEPDARGVSFGEVVETARSGKSSRPRRSRPSLAA